MKHSDSGADRSLAGGGDLKPAGAGSQSFGGAGGGALARADAIVQKTVPPASAPKETPPAKSKATDYGR